MDKAMERRKSRRFPVTLSASVVDARIARRVAILDVSAGGLLLSATDDFDADVGSLLTIEAPMIGRVETLVVAATEHGIHVRFNDVPEHFPLALEKISRLTRAWRLGVATI